MSYCTHLQSWTPVLVPRKLSLPPATPHCVQEKASARKMPQFSPRASDEKTLRDVLRRGPPRSFSAAPRLHRSATATHTFGLVCFDRWGVASMQRGFGRGMLGIVVLQIPFTVLLPLPSLLLNRARFSEGLGKMDATSLILPKTTCDTGGQQGEEDIIEET